MRTGSLHSTMGSTPVQAISPVQVTRLKDNALNVDFCDVSVNGKTTKNVYFAQAADIAFREYGFTNGNPWNTSVQYKRNILDRDTFKTGGFTTTYRFKVNDKFDYSNMKLVAERPELFTVKINGEQVKPIPGEWWLDRSFGVYSIGGQVTTGINTVELSVSPMSIFAEIEPVSDKGLYPDDTDHKRLFRLSDHSHTLQPKYLSSHSTERHTGLKEISPHILWNSLLPRNRTVVSVPSNYLT